MLNLLIDPLKVVVDNPSLQTNESLNSFEQRSPRARTIEQVRNLRLFLLTAVNTRVNLAAIPHMELEGSADRCESKVLKRVFFFLYSEQFLI